MSVSQSNFNLQDIDDILSHLSEREKTIVILRYGLDQGRSRTLEEVGEMFNVTGERIRQIEAKAIRKLHHWNPSSLNVLSQCLSNPQHVHSAKYTVRPKRAAKQSVMDEKNEKMQQCKRELMKMGFSEIESEYLLYCYRTYSIKDLLKLANPKDALMKLVKEKSVNVKSLGLFKVMPEDPFKIVEEIRIAMLPIHSALDYVRIHEELLTSFKFTSREISSLFHLKKTDLDKIANLTIYEILLYITKNEPPHVTNAETTTGKDIMLVVLRAIEEYKTNTSQSYKMRNFQACQAMQEIDKQHKTIKNIGIGMMIFSFISAFVASETGGGSFGVLALIFFAGLFIYIWHNNT